MSKASKQKSVPVTSLKSLGSAAPEFRLPVTITTLGGEEITVSFTARALRKTEWAALRDALAKPASAEESDTETETEAEAEPGPAPKFSFRSFVDGDMKKAADLLLKFATGWDLEDDFGAENLVEMEDRYGGSLSAVVTAYDAAIFHGRLGN